ncbi:hypothetical protein M422DRAFT_42663 [Sphaerobolus stellatus SS14]|nr:hypothetical protein M422DRAFT_42663 [Sphaerobolus stellatus SS14]
MLMNTMGGLHVTGAETRKTALVFSTGSTGPVQLIEVSLSPEELAKHFSEGAELMETRVHLDERGEVLPFGIRFVLDRSAFLNEAPSNDTLNDIAKSMGSPMRWFGTVIAFKLSQTYYNHVSISRARNDPKKIQSILAHVQGMRSVRGHGFERYKAFEFMMLPPNRASSSRIVEPEASGSGSGSGNN